MRSSFFLAALILFGSFLVPAVLADEPAQIPSEPQSKQAKVALDTLAAANKASADKMDAAVGSARKEYLAKLQAALDTAMSGDNLEEANSIKAEMDRTSKGDEGGEKPKGTTALDARRKYDRAIWSAKDERRRADDAAAKKCIADLQPALPVALKAKDLEEANRIHEEIARLKQTLGVASAGENAVAEPRNTEADPRGLKFEWFNGQDFETKMGERIDYKVSSNFGNGTAGTGGWRDNFSARWSGFIRAPKAGRYKVMGIGGSQEDGFRLKLDGKIVIDSWRNTGPRQNAFVEFTGEPQAFLFEMREGWWWTGATLLWVPPGETVPVVVPPTVFYQTREAAKANRWRRTPGTGLTMTVFGDKNLQKQAARGIDDNIDWWFDNGALASGMGADNFSIRWEGFIVAPEPGVYHLTTLVDDGVRLWIDHKILMDSWKGGGNNQTITVEFDERPHEILVEYCEYRGVAYISLHWAKTEGFDEQVIPPTAFFLNKTAAAQAIARRKEAEKK